jgi:hypothetical protein
MDTSNRQSSGAVVGQGSETEDTLSDLVARVANLKKVGCDELSPKQWAELINHALKLTKPHFKYLPFFLPAKGEKLFRFDLERSLSWSKSCIGNVKCSWLPEAFSGFIFRKFKGSPSDGELMAFRDHAKVVEICEVSGSVHDRSASTKVLLNDTGVFVYAHCRRPGGSFSVKPIIYDVKIFPRDNYLEGAINAYPQIGPRTLFVIALMLKDTYEKKLAVLNNLNLVGKTVEAICANVNVDHPHYVERYPWGTHCLNGEVVEEIRR